MQIKVYVIGNNMQEGYLVASILKIRIYLTKRQLIYKARMLVLIGKIFNDCCQKEFSDQESADYIFHLRYHISCCMLFLITTNCFSIFPTLLWSCLPFTLYIFSHSANTREQSTHSASAAIDTKRYY